MDVVWYDGTKSDADNIRREDVIIGVCLGDDTDEYLPLRDDCYYILHNMRDEVISQLNPVRLIKQQVYHLGVRMLPVHETRALADARLWHEQTRTLYQPWGTSVDQFDKPIVISRGNTVVHVGSIWTNTTGQGNVEVFDSIRKYCGLNGLRLLTITGIPNQINRLLVRSCRLAPSFCGDYQKRIGYLACRAFRNSSYGRLIVTNVKELNSVYKNLCIFEENAEQALEKALALNEQEETDLIVGQQEITKDYTYKRHLGAFLEILGLKNAD